MLQYFEHRFTKYESFQRQLYEFGFHRVNNATSSTIEYGAYYHTLFVRDKYELCHTMIRNRSSRRQPMENRIRIPSLAVIIPDQIVRTNNNTNRDDDDTNDAVDDVAAGNNSTITNANDDDTNNGNEHGDDDNDDADNDTDDDDDDSDVGDDDNGNDDIIVIDDSDDDSDDDDDHDHHHDDNDDDDHDDINDTSNDAYVTFTMSNSFSIFRRWIRTQHSRAPDPDLNTFVTYII